MEDRKWKDILVKMCKVIKCLCVEKVYLRISDRVYSGVLFRQGSGLLSTRLGRGQVVLLISYSQ